jgi:hypothetical protein
VRRSPPAKPIKPKMGPGNSSQATYSRRLGKLVVVREIAPMVRANLNAFCSDSAPPTRCDGHDLAANAENCGESATTAAPHRSIKALRSQLGSREANTGNRRQQEPDMANAAVATRALPRFLLSNPPRTQPTAPITMMTKDSPDAFARSGGPPSPVLSTSKGKRVQNA